MPVCQLLSPFSFKKRNRAEKKKKNERGEGEKKKIYWKLTTFWYLEFLQKYIRQK